MLAPSFQTIEYTTLKNQKRYFSTKRTKPRHESNLRQQPPSYQSVTNKQTSLLKGINSMNLTGNNSKEQSIFQQLNIGTSELLMLEPNDPKLSYKVSSEKDSASGRIPSTFISTSSKARQDKMGLTKKPSMFNRKGSNSMLYAPIQEKLSPYKTHRKTVFSPTNNISAELENSKRLETLIRGMLLQNDIQPSLKANEREMVMVQDAAPHLCQDALNLSRYLDVQIKPSDQVPYQPVLKDEPKMAEQSKNVFEQTIIAQKIDIIALQQIEKSKKELEKRIKERYSVLRSISSKARSRKTNSYVPHDINHYGAASVSNHQGSTVRYEYKPFEPVYQQSQHRKLNKKQHHNMTSLVNPSTIEYFSGQCSSLYGGGQQFAQKSPTALDKTSTIQYSQAYNHNSSLNQSSILSSKKVQRIQKKKIVIKDPSYSIPQRDLTPSYFAERKPIDGVKIAQFRGYSQLKQRPKSNAVSRPNPTQSGNRSNSTTIRHLRNRSGHIYLKTRKSGFTDINQTPSTALAKDSIFKFSPSQIEASKQSHRPDSISLLNNQDGNERRSASSRYQTLQSKEFQVQDKTGAARLSQNSTQGTNQFNLRQKLNFRYIADDNGIGTINSEREQEELMQTGREDSSPNRLNTNQSVLINTFHKPIQESGSHAGSLFNTPSAKCQQTVFQSSVINANRIMSKAPWKEQVDTESAGMSKTTMSTQRPMMSGGVNGYLGALQLQQTIQAKMLSKPKVISIQKGHFSSDSSYIRLRQTMTNQKHSTCTDGEDSQCKFEENEREGLQHDRLSKEQVAQIKEEEEYVEDEDSKKSNHINGPISQSHISTSRFIQGGPTRNQKGSSFNQEDSHCNIMASIESAVHGDCKTLRNDCNNLPGQSDNQLHREQLHSDDEVSIRRGLELSSFRSQLPNDPELLRQSTHSLLNRTRGAKGRQTMNLEQQQNEASQQHHNQYSHEVYEEEEVELCGNSYESYLKNADNFIK